MLSKMPARCKSGIENCFWSDLVESIPQTFDSFYFINTSVFTQKSLNIDSAGIPNHISFLLLSACLRRFGIFINHFKEEKVFKLFKVIAIVYIVITKDVAVIPNFWYDWRGCHIKFSLSFLLMNCHDLQVVDYKT